MSTKGLWAAALVLFCAGGCAPALSPAEKLTDEAAVKISQGNRTDAETALKQALELNPNLPWAHYNLATCFQARRAFVDAAASYRRALALFGTADRHAQSACLYGIASALDDMNDFGGALKAYETYLAFAGTAPDEANGATQARARMEVLRSALIRGLPSGKPMRVPLEVAAPASAPEAAAPAPAPPPPPPVAAPAKDPVAAPAKDPVAAPAKGKAGRGTRATKRRKGQPAPAK